MSLSGPFFWARRVTFENTSQRVGLPAQTTRGRIQDEEPRAPSSLLAAERGFGTQCPERPAHLNEHSKTLSAVDSASFQGAGIPHAASKSGLLDAEESDRRSSNFRAPIGAWGVANATSPIESCQERRASGVKERGSMIHRQGYAPARNPHETAHEPGVAEAQARRAAGLPAKADLQAE